MKKMLLFIAVLVVAMLSACSRTETTPTLAEIIENVNNAETLYEAANLALLDTMRPNVRSIVGNDNTGIVIINVNHTGSFMPRETMIRNAGMVVGRLQERNDIESIDIHWHMMLVNARGDEFDTRVMRLEFDRPSLRRVDFNSLLSDQALAYADRYFIHNVLQ